MHLERILARRELVTTVLRLASLGLFVVASVFFIFPLAKGALWGSLHRLFSLYDNVVQFGIAVALGVPATAILLLNRRLTKWLVPLPAPLCPRCGYELQGLKDARCPECGQPLPQEFVEDQPPPVEPPPRR